MNNSEYNAGPLVAIIALFLTLTLISVILRLYVRLRITDAFEIDDYLICAAQINFVCDCVFLCFGVHYGLGRHNHDLSQANEIQGLKYQALATLGYVSNMMFIKLSIGFFLLRIAVKPRFVWILRITMVIVAIWSVAIWIFDLFQCRPIAAQWDLTIKNAKCVSGNAFAQAAYSISVMTIVSDWLYALIPIPMIWHVQMNLHTKITVIFILSLGVFASIATIIRLKYIVDLTDVSDVLFTGTTAMVWTLVEPAVAIIAASLVTIRPLLRSMKITGFESTDRRINRVVGRDGYGLSRKRNGREQTNELSLRNDVPDNNWTSKVGIGTEVRKAATRKFSLGGKGSHMELREVELGAPSESRMTFYRDTGSEEHIMDDVYGIGVRRTVDVDIEHNDVGRMAIND